MAKVLFIGDIFGKGGREVLRQVLPQWREKYKPDVIVVNVENMAHGKGVTMNTMDSIKDLGIDCYTSGNHVFDKGALSDECFENYDSLIRPANIGASYKGYGYYRFSKPKGGNGNKGSDGNQQFLIINLHGTVFLEKEFGGTLTNPFLAVDKILLEQGQKGDIIIIDLHADATSEKVAFGHYVDGRVSFVTGTHTHVPTADARVLPGGTAYITDAGMTGPRDGVIGVKKQNVVAKFLDPNVKFKNDPEDEGVMMINGVLVEVGDNQGAVKIEKLYQEVS